MILGERLKNRLKTLGFSQSELARRIGVTQPTIQKLITGDSQGSKHLHRIARELRTTTDYLIGESDDADSEDQAITITNDEQDLLDMWRQLDPGSRAAVFMIVRNMVMPNTLHSPQLEYRVARNDDRLIDARAGSR